MANNRIVSWRCVCGQTFSDNRELVTHMDRCGVFNSDLNNPHAQLAAVRAEVANLTAERDTASAAVDHWRKLAEELKAANETGRELLVEQWGRAGFGCFILADGTVHPGADSTVAEVFTYLWPDGKPAAAAPPNQET